jgi:hypothetical protein
MGEVLVWGGVSVSTWSWFLKFWKDEVSGGFVAESSCLSAREKTVGQIRKVQGCVILETFLVEHG